MKLLIVIFVSIALSAWAQSDRNVAKVSLLRGQAIVKSLDGKSRELKQDEWVSQGDIIQTKEKSFAKLTFTDKSTMNVGPASEVNINKFGGGEAGLISVIKGQIRSQVTKDVLKQEQDKSKLIIKTKTAAMGIRGTDFLVSFSPETERTNLITFEGNVAMAQIEASEAPIIDIAQLETIVSDPNRAVSVTDGLYAGSSPEQQHVTTPTKISPMQFETLKENENMETKTSTSNTTSFHSIVPPGLSAKTVSNDQEIPLAQEKTKTELPSPEGQVDSRTGAVAPPAGGIIDLKTGFYIAPPPGSKFDANAGVYIVPSTHGTVDNKGDFKAPEGLKLNNQGGFIPIDSKAPPINQDQTQNGPSKNQNVSPDAVLKVATQAPQVMPAAFQPRPNDVLGGGFFIPGNYFIDNRDTSINPNLNNPTETKVKFNIQAQ
ncbi:MAG: FecR family protein [Bacteriovoracaceae bacterium]